MKANRFTQISNSIIWLCLTLFAVIPLLCLIFTSVMPETPVLHPTMLRFTLHHYSEVLGPTYRYVIIKSIYLGLTTTLICLFIAYPYALCLTKLKQKNRGIILLLTIIPFWTSSLLRTYAIITILKTQGLLNKLLLKLHLIHKPILILFTKSAVLIGLVYNLLPFMILPLYHSIENLDPDLYDAAYDLGASRIQTFFKVTLPLTLHGILSGCIMVFLPAITLFYIPDLLGGAKTLLLGNLIQYEFLMAQNWPLGAAIGVTLLGSIALLSYVATLIRELNPNE